ncbi:MAG: hypothetical protein ACTSPI_11650 [Candidatus Heimdallarchaeaceae archaeon]
MEEEIKKLTRLWYELVSLDHHKDRDCHWSIEVKYSYMNDPTYSVIHYGYIYGDVNKEFSSYEKAEVGLLEELHEAFEGELLWADKVLKNISAWDSHSIEKAKEIKKIYNKAIIPIK